MIALYKIVLLKYDEAVVNLIQLNPSERRGHKYKMYKIQTRLNLRSNTFIHRSVNFWNSLPTCVVNSPSVEAFKRWSDKFWKDFPIKYNSEENIYGRGMLKTIQKYTNDIRI